jgi:hypothetical protein
MRVHMREDSFTLAPALEGYGRPCVHEHIHMCAWRCVQVRVACALTALFSIDMRACMLGLARARAHGSFLRSHAITLVCFCPRSPIPRHHHGFPQKIPRGRGRKGERAWRASERGRGRRREGLACERKRWSGGGRGMEIGVCVCACACAIVRMRARVAVRADACACACARQASSSSPRRATRRRS